MFQTQLIVCDRLNSQQENGKAETGIRFTLTLLLP